RFHICISSFLLQTSLALPKRSSDIACTMHPHSGEYDEIPTKRINLLEYQMVVITYYKLQIYIRF
ncbi:MAG: hypothetical protein VW684_14435, partial [Betaproteobacteria bacterium]